VPGNQKANQLGGFPNERAVPFGSLAEEFVLLKDPPDDLSRLLYGRPPEKTESFEPLKRKPPCLIPSASSIPADFREGSELNEGGKIESL